MAARWDRRQGEKERLPGEKKEGSGGERERGKTGKKRGLWWIFLGEGELREGGANGEG